MEVAWFRRLAQVAGATSVALAGVLAAVIGGMAIGSFLFGRVSDRVRAPGRLYAMLEAGVCACALLSPWWIDLAAPVYVALADAPFLRFLFSVVHLAPAAVLMGGTLPALAAALDVAPERRGRALGNLYAANTLGAVAGTALAGFALLPAVGLAASMRWAAAGAGIAALLAWTAPVTRAPTAASEAGDENAARVRRAVWLYAISGFLGMASEVAFTRGLVLVFGSSTYAFTATLAVYLLGIGAGGAIGARLATPERDALAWLGRIVAATAATLALAALALYHLPRLYMEIHLRLGTEAASGSLAKLGLSAAVLLPGALGLGLAFPFAVRVASAARAGAGTGLVYGANTLASILGSTAAVYLFVPAWGPHLAIVAPALVVAALAWWFVRSRVAVIALALVAVAFVGPSDVAEERLAMGVYYAPGRYVRDNALDEEAWADGVDLPYTKYGREATVSLFRWYGTLSLLVDGKAVATQQSVGDVQHLELLGHLPMALHEKPERVLVVGLGLGTTYRAVASHEPPDLVVVEIEEAVADAVAELGLKPRGLEVQDARLYLKAHDEPFDVITSDPIHPWVRGGGDLYTKEYFELCLQRLGPGGVMCHWLPLYQMGFEDVRAVAATFAAVFHTEVYFAGTDLVLVGRREPAAAARDGVVMGESVRNLLVAGHDAVVAAAKGAPILTEDALRLEFSAPGHLDSTELPEILRWVAAMWKQPPVPYGALLDAQIAEYAGEGEALSAALARITKEAPEHEFGRRFVGERYLHYAGASNRESFLRAARRLLRDDPRLMGVEADLLAAQGKRAEAEKLYRKLLERQPGNRYVERRLARVTDGS